MTAETKSGTATVFERLDAMTMNELERELAKLQFERAALLVDLVAVACASFVNGLQRMRAAVSERPYRRTPKTPA